MSTLSKQQRQQILSKAQNQCGYCQLQEIVSGVPLTIEHIFPKSKGGTNDVSNLWVSCRLCNEAKSNKITGFDHETQQSISLFNPYQQEWETHFEWDSTGTMIKGMTPCGRVTVDVLQLNSEFRRLSRAIWVSVGLHPP